MARRWPISEMAPRLLESGRPITVQEHVDDEDDHGTQQQGFLDLRKEARMVSERSSVTTRSIFDLSKHASSGNSALTASTTSMCSRPGFWNTCTDTAGFPVVEAVRPDVFQWRHPPCQ